MVEVEQAVTVLKRRLSRPILGPAYESVNPSIDMEAWNILLLSNIYLILNNLNVLVIGSLLKLFENFVNDLNIVWQVCSVHSALY